MLLVPLLVCLTAAPGPASPRAVVLVTRRTEVSDKEALALALEAQRQLAAAGVRIESTAGALKQLAKLSFVDTSACAARPVCVTELGRQLGVEVVVGLSVADLEEDRAVSFEALRIRDGVVLEREQLVFPRRQGLPANALQAFAAALRSPTTGEPPVAIAPVPLAPVDAPLLPPPPPVLAPQSPAAAAVLVEPVAPRSRALPIVALSAAGAATAAGVALLAVHLVNRNALAVEQGRPRLTYPEAEATRDRANVTLVGAAVSAGLAAALGTTAALTW